MDNDDDDDDDDEEDDDEVDDDNEEEEQEEARHGWRRRQLSTSLCGAAGVAPDPGIQSNTNTNTIFSLINTEQLTFNI